MSSLLQNIQDACAELGLSAPSSVVGSTDATAKQMLAIFNAVGAQLYTEADWQFLFAEYRFSTVTYTVTGDVTANSNQIANISNTTGLSSNFMVTGTGMMQDSRVTGIVGTTATLSVPATASGTGVSLTFGQVAYDMPSDYDRIVNKTEYNKSQRWSILGPKDAQEWQWLKASYITTGPRARFRIINNQFNVWPIPPVNAVLGYEYLSKNWCTDSLGVRKNRFTADTDLCLFPDRLMIEAVKMRFLEAKGFDSSAPANYMQRELSKLKAQNAGADTLSLAPSTAGTLFTTNNLPDSGFGTVTG